VIALDLLRALGPNELVLFLWFLIVLDVPRYLIAALVLRLVPPRAVVASNPHRVTGMVSCHNEERALPSCVASMRANGIERVVVVNDGSTDRTHAVAEGLGVIVIDLPERVGKPNALNVALPCCEGELVLVADADTVFDAGSVAQAAARMRPDVGGMNFTLVPVNEGESLTTAFQGIEYAIASANREFGAAFGILNNVSGAAGLFRRDALLQVGGWDCEVAEDAALSMKLRDAGWQLDCARDAVARTVVPSTVVGLMLQRFRWDASIVTIWWRKWPPWRAGLASFDVLLFGMVMPLALPFYVLWLWSRIGAETLVILGAVWIAMAVLDLTVIVLSGVPLRLLPYVPLYLVMQTLVMRPVRIVALLAELAFSITHFDPYIPKSQRSRLT
jgi:cellulose synthase/poly-beta-1,6-N-acetylglucosamine synthase-like glycosyltransferase